MAGGAAAPLRTGTDAVRPASGPSVGRPARLVHQLDAEGRQPGNGSHGTGAMGRAGLRRHVPARHGCRGRHVGPSARRPPLEKTCGLADSGMHEPPPKSTTQGAVDRGWGSRPCGGWPGDLGADGIGRRQPSADAVGLERPVPAHARPTAVPDGRAGNLQHGASQPHGDPGRPLHGDGRAPHAPQRPGDSRPHPFPLAVFGRADEDVCAGTVRDARTVTTAIAHCDDTAAANSDSNDNGSADADTDRVRTVGAIRVGIAVGADRLRTAFDPGTRPVTDGRKQPDGSDDLVHVFRGSGRCSAHGHLGDGG